MEQQLKYLHYVPFPAPRRVCFSCDTDCVAVSFIASGAGPFPLAFESLGPGIHPTYFQDPCLLVEPLRAGEQSVYFRFPAGTENIYAIHLVLLTSSMLAPVVRFQQYNAYAGQLVDFSRFDEPGRYFVQLFMGGYLYLYSPPGFSGTAYPIGHLEPFVILPGWYL